MSRNFYAGYFSRTQAKPLSLGELWERDTQYGYVRFW